MTPRESRMTFRVSISQLDFSWPLGNSLCRGQEKHTLCELDVQIANSGLGRTFGRLLIKGVHFD